MPAITMRAGKGLYYLTWEMVLYVTSINNGKIIIVISDVEHTHDFLVFKIFREYNKTTL